MIIIFFTTHFFHSFVSYSLGYESEIHTSDERKLAALVQLQENNNSKGIMNQNITFKTGTMAELKEPKTWK
ncbi:hypothetical protein NQT66_05025 [Cellulophaga baltica]|uniref:hypothetical protein n=1 Tax=Cellulophaga baltica TaxID=76594 RepID=UPI0021483757|nr:hypothetical protein [Cellulophaga baltica]MCR1024157.1 hypothetical protein [Cellulophaga baltica]